MASSTMKRDGAFVAAGVGLLLLVHFALAHFTARFGPDVMLRLGIYFVVCTVLAGAGWVGMCELRRLGRWQWVRTLQAIVGVQLTWMLVDPAARNMFVALNIAVVLFAALPLALYFRHVDRGSARAR